MDCANFSGQNPCTNVWFDPAKKEVICDQADNAYCTNYKSMIKEGYNPPPKGQKPAPPKAAPKPHHFDWEQPEGPTPIQALRVHNFRPGDVLLVKVVSNTIFDPESAAELKEYIEQALPEGIKVIYTSGVEYELLRGGEHTNQVDYRPFHGDSEFKKDDVVSIREDRCGAYGISVNSWFTVQGVYEYRSGGINYELDCPSKPGTRDEDGKGTSRIVPGTTPDFSMWAGHQLVKSRIYPGWDCSNFKANEGNDDCANFTNELGEGIECAVVGTTCTSYKGREMDKHLVDRCSMHGHEWSTPMSEGQKSVCIWCGRDKIRKPSGGVSV